MSLKLFPAEHLKQHNQGLNEFFSLFSYFADGFAYAAEALAGRYIGAGDSLMLAKVISRLFTWGGAIALFFKLIFMFGGYLILKRLTNEPVTIRATGTYIYWVVLVSVLLLQPLSGKGFMWAPQPQKPGEMGLWY